MYNVASTQLPETATDLAKAMDVLEERLFGLPVEMITKDPWSVDVGLLDHLAWESSVDAWEADWPEEVKRAVIAVSAQVHRHKGTPYAVKQALMAFGVNVELLEWWEPDGSGVPGTFTARAFITDPLDGSGELTVTAPVVSAMKSVLSSVSPVSRQWSLQFGVRAIAPAYVGLVSTIHVRAIAAYRIDPAPVVIVAASSVVAPVIHLKTIVTTS